MHWQTPRLIYHYRYIYYHCTMTQRCREKSIEARQLETTIIDFLGRLTVSPRILDWAYAQLAQADADDGAHHVAAINSLETARADVERQRKTLLQLRTRNLVNDADFVEERNRLDAEQAQLNDQLQAPSDPGAADAAAFASFVFAARARDWFAVGGPEVKRTIVTAVASNLVLTGKTLRIDARPPFQAMADIFARGQPPLPPIEPPRSPVIADETAPAGASCPTLCVYCTKLAPISKTNDVARSARVVA